MRLAVVSHPCVTPVNQGFYARVQELTGWDVTILLPNRWKNEYGRYRPERWPQFHGRLVPLPVALPGSIPLHVYLAAMRRRLRALMPDLVYMHHEPYAAATFQVFRAACGLDGVAIGFYSAQNLAKRYPRPVARWERWVYAHADFAFPVSTDVADVLRGKGFKGRTEILPLPVDTRRFHPPLDGRDDARPFTAGYVGRLAEEKGVDTLLEALSIVDAVDTRLLVVGDGPAREALAATAREIQVGERVTWAGYVPHDIVADAYRKMDVLVVPSKTVPTWKEQFGRVVVEALACGVPVIASDSGELPNLLKQTKGGWLFREGDAKHLAEVLDNVATGTNGSSKEVAMRGREAVGRMFDTDAVAQRFISVCEQVRA